MRSPEVVVSEREETEPAGEEPEAPVNEYAGNFEPEEPDTGTAPKDGLPSEGRDAPQG